MDVRAFIAANVVPVDDDMDSRLCGPTAKTKALWDVCVSLLQEEYNRGGCLAVDTCKPSHITSHAPGYIDGDGKTLDDVVVVGDRCVVHVAGQVRTLGLDVCYVDVPSCPASSSNHPGCKRRRFPENVACFFFSRFL